MPINPTYPGVYIEELENPVKSIVGVSTSVTAFVGRALKGPVNEPTLIHNFGEFGSTFGGLWKESVMSYSVYQYFLNGGVDAVIVRVVHSDAQKAKFENTAETGITFEAANEGSWADNFRVTTDNEVNNDAEDHDNLFNVRVKENVGGNYIERESFLNVSFEEGHKRYVVTVLREESKLVRVSTISLTARPSGEVNFDVAATTGQDGSDLEDSDIEGDEDDKEGIYALANTDIFNLLCIPPPDPDGTTTSGHYSSVYTNAADYCERRRAMLIVDPPSNWTDKDDPVDTTKGIDGASFGLTRTANAAIYFPHIKAPDPLSENRLKAFPPSGAVAGVIAKTDAQRGVWKAPAGIDATLAGVPDLDIRLTDEENGTLNPQGINCLRILPPAGRVIWGARTMKGADRLANQWKYLPVRRMALYIEESLYRGTQWVVFEPNDEPLWSQIRLNVGAFMHDLFRKGAFQGSTPKEAYLVKCDKETTTQTDIDKGIVNIVVGFAPLKPAEFVMIKIQQLAGQTEGQ
ncbi:MAG: phage tail sheath subtilisin-like domain-containing protein [Thaumarchaeota archaeon]|nr:phage tail sheath subtilisin-like domain-containing protein [Nitrososphaerota archaeon]MCL5317207.1 phage tail sheath subtilisin-like domain-containing protein [Nitrososphaerota archaeon]